MCCASVGRSVKHVVFSLMSTELISRRSNGRYRYRGRLEVAQKRAFKSQAKASDRAPALYDSVR